MTQDVLKVYSRIKNDKHTEVSKPFLGQQHALLCVHGCFIELKMHASGCVYVTSLHLCHGKQ